ncbi:MAG: MBL fold metallo-hydrolase, partial [Eubacterium sp.]|nr:MBL fold metallo-hydrolase [Eubacterium sp.]
IDGGNVEDGPFVAEFLQQRGVRSLEYIVATHPHEDHVGGIGSILGKIPVGTLLSPVDEMPARDASEGNEDTSSQQLNISAYSVLRRQLRQNRISVSIPAPGSHYALGNADIEILGPVSSETDNLNDLSIVLRIVYGDVSFLFTGDAEYQELQDITESGAVLSSDVLKVAHHGSTDAANFSFLEAVSPSCAIISVGADNEHYHPTEKLLRMLEDIGARILRTDRHGTICITSDGKTLQYHVTADDSAANGSAANNSATNESAVNNSAADDSATPASHS